VPDEPADVVSGVNHKKKRNKGSALEAVGGKHKPIIEGLVADTRRRKHSSRTEQAHEAWVRRGIAKAD